jgi:serine phosphatase RsbU (regulator of sigma subunit)/PAS domain-containing protein
VGAVSLAIVAVVVAVDRIAGERAVLLGLLIVPPLLCCVTTTPGTTRAVAILVVLVAAASFVWDHALDSARYWVSVAVVAVGSAFAVVMADYRGRARRDATRMQLLADVATAAHGGQDVPSLARSIAALLAPRLVDLCVIDLAGPDGRPQRVAAAFGGSPEVLEALLRRPLNLWPADEGSAATALPTATQHLPRIDDALRRRLAHDEDDIRLLGQMAIESALVVPLRVRDRTIGALGLGTRAPRPRFESGEDVEYAETLAGRVALALDNAALSAELSSTERQLQTILATVDAAIMVRHSDGRLVYANQAAADLLRLPGPEAVTTQPSHALMELFDVYSEDGDPVSLRDLPGARLLAGEVEPAPMVVRSVVKATGDERWLLNRATPVTDDEGRVVMAVNLIEDITETKRSEIAQRLLAQTARQAAEAADLPATLRALADAAVPALADWASVDLVDARGRITPVAIAHRDPDKVRLGWHLRTAWPARSGDAGGIAAVIATGEPQLLRDITDDMLVAGSEDDEHLGVLRAVGLNSTMIVPIRAGARTLGALSFVSSTSRRFDERDLQLARDLGRQAGAFISNAQHAAEQAHIAHTLQAGLIPDALPLLHGWRASSVYRAAGRANEVGGDFYDIVTFDGGWTALIGDVVGKGAEAAALTALARHTLAAIIASTGDAAHALRVLNRRLRQHDADVRRLCTIALVTVTRADRATVVAAGHPLPILVRDAIARPVGRTSPMLGVVDDPHLRRSDVDLMPGDHLVLYTDGVVDAIGEADRFGDGRLVEAVESLAAAGSDNLAADLIAVLDAFSTGEQTDDIAILALTAAGAAAAREPEGEVSGSPRLS